jgi:hypothetical protein
MLEWLKSTWARWKVQVSFVGGVLVIATAYGTCSYEPQVVSDAGDNSSAGEATAEPVSVEVSETTTTTAETSTDVGNEEGVTAESTTGGTNTTGE